MRKLFNLSNPQKNIWNIDLFYGKTAANNICGTTVINQKVDFEKLNKRIEELGMNKEEYTWYTNLRRYGTTVHSGFGMGFERLIMYMTGMDNIRDVSAFPRTPGNCLY